MFHFFIVIRDLHTIVKPKINKEKYLKKRIYVGYKETVVIWEIVRLKQPPTTKEIMNEENVKLSTYRGLNWVQLKAQDRFYLFCRLGLILKMFE